MRLGRIKPSRRPRLRLTKYLRQLPITPPGQAGYTAPAAASLGNPYLNTQLGDCVIAGAFHVRGVTSANSGDREVMFGNADVIHDYSAIGGFNPNAPQVWNGGQLVNPTDNGCDELTALDYWTNIGFADGVKLAGYLAVDATNRAECEAALYLFENLYFGMALPDYWLAQPNIRPGFYWDAAGPPEPQNGHCVAGFAYDSTGVTIDSWGMLGTITWKAMASYAVPAAGGELYVLLSPDMISKAQKKAPNGLDWPTLLADFNVLAGRAPPPAPIPVNPPAPVNPPTPSPLPVPGDFAMWLQAAFDAVKAWSQTQEGQQVIAIVEKQGIQALESFIASLLAQKPTSAAHVAAHVARKLAA